RLEVAHEVHASAQGAATDVEQTVLWREAARLQELELQRTDLVPQPADQRAMLLVGDFRRAQLTSVFVHRHRHDTSNAPATRARRSALYSVHRAAAADRPLQCAAVATTTIPMPLCAFTEGRQVRRARSVVPAGESPAPAKELGERASPFVN